MSSARVASCRASERTNRKPIRCEAGMNIRLPHCRAAAAAGIAVWFACATPAAGIDAAATTSVGAAPEMLATLDCDRLSPRDIRDVLASTRAPRIIAISGSFNAVSMDPFARFLVAMGYPAARIRNPADGAWSYPSSGSSARLAGMIAWHYERDGMVPILIGYSGGGMLAVRTLHELAGAFASRVTVVDALTGEALPRDTIVDPASGRERPALGLKVPYACALATGLLPRLILGQWTMLGKLHDIPDTVDEFTGFVIEWDAIAGTFPGATPYAATGSAHVRNVTLPATYRHVDLPRTEQLAANPATRVWIDDYRPGTALPLLDAAVDATNLLHAADIWHSVATNWCREAKRLARSREGQ
jgi:hypothetical protein